MPEDDLGLAVRNGRRIRYPSVGACRTERSEVMRISERQVGSVAILDLCGPLVGPKAAEMVEATVRRHVDTGTRRLVANLAGVKLVDLGGLGALVEGWRVMRSAGGVFSLASVTKQIHDLVVITRLLTIFETFDSVEEAVADAGGGQPASEPSLSPIALGSIQRFLRRV